MNSVQLIGRLTKNPELTSTNNGTKKVTFTLAVNREMSQSAYDTPNADFIMCTAWKGTAEAITAYLDKGSKIAVSGRLNTYNYDNQQGQRVYVTEVLCNRVEFLDNKKSVEHKENNSTTSNSYRYKEYYSDDSLDIASDDLPF